MRALLLSATVLGLSVTALGCNFAEDLDEVRDNALKERAPEREPSDECEQYCALSADNCDESTASQIYASSEECFAACALFPNDGVPGETSGNTVYCRITHLGYAEFSSTHCLHGSPDGGGVCIGESPCGSYCAAVIEHCKGPQLIEFPGETEHENIQRCLNTCQTDYDQSGGEDDTTGDTLQCRSNAANLALGNPDVFCPQAAPDGGGVCVDVE